MLADDNHSLVCEWCLIRIMIGIMLLRTKSNDQLLKVPIA